MQRPRECLAGENFIEAACGQRHDFAGHPQPIRCKMVKQAGSNQQTMPLEIEL